MDGSLTYQVREDTRFRWNCVEDGFTQSAGCTFATRRALWLSPGGISSVRGMAGFLLGGVAGGRGLLGRAPVERLFDEHVSGRANHSHRIWALYVLDRWLSANADT